MGNKKNHARKNRRLANNWRAIIKMRLIQFNSNKKFVLCLNI